MQSDLYQKIELIKASDSFHKYTQDKEKLDERTLKKTFPSDVIRQYDAIDVFKMLDFETYEKGITIFGEQISHFGAESEIYFKPFNILKKIYIDDSEVIVNDNGSFKEVNDDEFLSFSINNTQDLAQKTEEVTEWFMNLSSSNEEGIMIKPKTVFVNSLPPALKVRNNQYLVMIYGVDFLKNYHYNMQKRSVGKKIQCSINDWLINQAMLKVKYEEIHTENYYFKNLVFDRIMGEQIESTIDSRL